MACLRIWKAPRILSKRRPGGNSAWGKVLQHRIRMSRRTGRRSDFARHRAKTSGLLVPRWRRRVPEHGDRNDEINLLCGELFLSLVGEQLSHQLREGRCERAFSSAE